MVRKLIIVAGGYTELYRSFNLYIREDSYRMDKKTLKEIFETLCSLVTEDIDERPTFVAFSGENVQDKEINTDLTNRFGRLFDCSVTEKLICFDDGRSPFSAHYSLLASGNVEMAHHELWRILDILHHFVKKTPRLTCYFP